MQNNASYINIHTYLEWMKKIILGDAQESIGCLIHIFIKIVDCVLCITNVSILRIGTVHHQ